MTTDTTAHDKAQDRVDPAVLKTGLVLVVGGVAVVFDTTIVSVALHTLAADLHTAISTIQWVTTGYLLALGIAVPLSTWGLKRFGGKRLWMFSLAVFLVGSIGSSLAWNAGVLIGWRVVQGVGGGLMLPVMVTLVMQAAGGKALGRTVTIVALPALLGPILGPLLGGVILTHLSWRYMFWVNVPFCVAGLVLAAITMAPDVLPERRPELDLPGFLLLAPGGRGGRARALERRPGGRVRAPRCLGSAGRRLRAVGGLLPLRAACGRATGRHPAVLAPPRRLGVRGAVLLRLRALRCDAAAAALLPGGPRRNRPARRRDARPPGDRDAAEPEPGGTAHGQDRRPPDHGRRLRDHRPCHAPLRLCRPAHERPAARAVAVGARLRPGRG